MKTNTSLWVAFLISMIGISQAKDIFEAAREGDLETVKAIIATDVSALNALDANGETPLFSAVELEKTNVATFLLSKGADPTIANKNGVSPLQMANVLGDEQVLGLAKATPVANVAASKPIKNNSDNEKVGDDADTEPTNEYVALAEGAGILRIFDVKGLLLESNGDYLPRIPLSALNDQGLEAILKSKQGWLTLTVFDPKHYNETSSSDQGQEYAYEMWQIWTNGNSIQERIQTRLRIFNDMSEYNSDTKSYQAYYQAYMNYVDALARKYDPLYTQPDVSVNNEMVSMMEMNDPISTLRDSASNQQEIYRSRISSCVSDLSGFGIIVPGVPTDPSQDLPDSLPFVRIRPFRCIVK